MQRRAGPKNCWATGLHIIFIKICCWKCKHKANICFAYLLGMCVRASELFSIFVSQCLCDGKGLNYVAAVGTRLEFSAGCDVRGNLAPITCNCLWDDLADSTTTRQPYELVGARLGGVAARSCGRTSPRNISKKMLVFMRIIVPLEALSCRSI